MTLKNSIHAADTTTAVVIDWLQQQQQKFVNITTLACRLNNEKVQECLYRITVK